MARDGDEVVASRLEDDGALHVLVGHEVAIGIEDVDIGIVEARELDDVAVGRDRDREPVIVIFDLDLPAHRVAVHDQHARRVRAVGIVVARAAEIGGGRSGRGGRSARARLQIGAGQGERPRCPTEAQQVEDLRAHGPVCIQSIAHDLPSYSRTGGIPASKARENRRNAPLRAPRVPASPASVGRKIEGIKQPKLNRLRFLPPIA